MDEAQYDLVIELEKPLAVAEHRLVLPPGLQVEANSQLPQDPIGNAVVPAARVRTGVAFADLDRFKSVNDTYGHSTGDQILRTTADLLKAQVRSSDIVARYGGEEFAVILPNTDLNAAMAIAESVRSMVAGKHLRKKNTGAVIGNITLSLGVARYRAGERRRGDGRDRR